MNAPHSHELALPSQRWVALLILALLVGAAVCSVLALSNLASGIAPCASLLWLIVVMCWMVGAALLARQQGGVLRVLLEFAADACGHRAVAWVPTEAERPFLQLVVRIAGWRCVVRRIEIAKIHWVEWSPGQASYIAKRDMHDWHVAIWFDPDAIQPRRWDRARSSNVDLVCLGPESRRDQAATLGHAIVVLLHTAGLHLVASPNPDCFVRQPAAGGQVVGPCGWHLGSLPAEFQSQASFQEVSAPAFSAGIDGPCAGTPVPAGDLWNPDLLCALNGHRLAVHIRWKIVH